MPKSYDQSAHEALAFIAETVRRRGYPPSRQEIADHLGFAGRGSTQPIIERMKERGLIRVDPQSPRAMTITEAGMKALTEEMQ